MKEERNHSDDEIQEILAEYAMRWFGFGLGVGIVLVCIGFGILNKYF